MAVILPVIVLLGEPPAAPKRCMPPARALALRRRPLGRAHGQDGVSRGLRAKAVYTPTACRAPGERLLTGCYLSGQPAPPNPYLSSPASDLRLGPSAIPAEACVSVRPLPLPRRPFPPRPAVFHRPGRGPVWPAAAPPRDPDAASSRQGPSLPAPLCTLLTGVSALAGPPGPSGHGTQVLSRSRRRTGPGPGKPLVLAAGGPGATCHLLLLLHAPRSPGPSGPPALVSPANPAPQAAGDHHPGASRPPALPWLRKTLHPWGGLPSAPSLPPPAEGSLLQQLHKLQRHVPPGWRGACLPASLPTWLCAPRPAWRVLSGPGLPGARSTAGSPGARGLCGDQRPQGRPRQGEGCGARCVCVWSEPSSASALTRSVSFRFHCTFRCP